LLAQKQKQQEIQNYQSNIIQEEKQEGIHKR
jgi:hypothetical protein